MNDVFTKLIKKYNKELEKYLEKEAKLSKKEKIKTAILYIISDLEVVVCIFAILYMVNILPIEVFGYILFFLILKFFIKEMI